MRDSSIPSSRAASPESAESAAAYQERPAPETSTDATAGEGRLAALTPLHVRMQNYLPAKNGVSKLWKEYGEGGMKEVIGAQHEFHDKEFVEGWAERFEPTRERRELFDVILSELKSNIPECGFVVELGIGPGYLAEHVLRAMGGIYYFGIDFSAPMLDIARRRLSAYSARVGYAQADLIRDQWWRRLPASVDAIVSSWALHDLGSQENVEYVYRCCAVILQDRGLLLNGEFIKPGEAIHEYEPGRFEVARHIEMLHSVGFQQAECLAVLEEEIETPTASQNYACLKGVMKAQG